MTWMMGIIFKSQGESPFFYNRITPFKTNLQDSQNVQGRSAKLDNNL